MRTELLRRLISLLIRSTRPVALSDAIGCRENAAKAQVSMAESLRTTSSAETRGAVCGDLHSST
jgi:hypothetical protein